MEVLICVLALAFLMFVAYRGFSVIVCAPIAALGAVALTHPGAVLPVYTGLFMDSMATFLKNYFVVFLLGALFGKVMELSGFAQSIAEFASRVAGPNRSMLAIVLVCAMLVYGGVTVFVVVFAVYPFAAAMFRVADIPKRLLPATVALGSFTFAMDAIPGSPQVQNIIPTTFFGTTTLAAPRLGMVGAVLIFGAGMSYLEWRRRSAAVVQEGYGDSHINEPEGTEGLEPPHPIVAIMPLALVVTLNVVFTRTFPTWFAASARVVLADPAKPIVNNIAALVSLWAVAVALVSGILAVVLLSRGRLMAKFGDGTRAAVAGCLLAAMNVASEFGFGAVIAALPGFLAIQRGLALITDPLLNAAVSVTTLAGITGSAAGGISIALAALSSKFIASAAANGIPLEVLHRISVMAAGGMDTLPHNGAVITLLLVTGLTHRQAYGDIFAITCIKTVAAFVLVFIYSATGLV